MAAWSCCNDHEAVSNRDLNTKHPPNCLDPNPTSFMYYLSDFHKILNPAVIKSNTLYKETGRQPIVFRMTVTIQKDGTCKASTVILVIQRTEKIQDTMLSMCTLIANECYYYHCYYYYIRI